MPQSNHCIHPWKQLFDKRVWKTSTKSCKKSCKVMEFYWSERIRILLFLGSSVRKNFDPTFVATLQGASLSARFQKGQIQESTWKSGWIFLRSSMEFRVFGLLRETENSTRYRGVRVNCLMLRGIVQIGCYDTFVDVSRQLCKYGSKGNFHDHKYGRFGFILFVSV